MSYVYNLVRYAIKRGELVRPMICEGCGMIRATFAHHDDYMKPLEVRWLCKPCHAAWHAKNGPGLNAELTDLPPARKHQPKSPRAVGRPRMDDCVAEARFKDMTALMASGWTLQAIGEKYGVSRERVRQIIGSYRKYRPTVARVRQLAAADCLGEINDLRREGMTLREIAAKLSLEVKDIRSVAWVESRALKHGTMNGYNKHKCRCSLCRKKATSIQAQISRDLHAKGICTICRKPVGGKQWLCETCRAHHNELYNKSKGPKISRSGVKGISWNSNEGKWRVIRYIDGKQRHFGSFRELEDAKKRNDEIRAA